MNNADFTHCHALRQLWTFLWFVPCNLGNTEEIGVMLQVLELNQQDLKQGWC